MVERNILVITGSPRKEGNSNALAEAFIRGAQKKGHTVYKFSAAEHAVQGCMACDHCWSEHTACVYDDSFRKLEPLLDSADVIVFATPLYWSSMSSQIKAAIDKLYAYCSSKCKRPLKIKESVLLVCGECEGMDIFNGIKEVFGGIARFMKWEERGVIAVPQVFAVGDIKKTDALERAEKFGMSI